MMSTHPVREARRYRWEDLPRDTPMPGIDRRRIMGEKMMISELFLVRGAVVPTHSHENEQFAYVARGALRFGLGAEGSRERHEVTILAGEVLHLPSNLPHSAAALEDSLVIDVFAPPSERTGVDSRLGSSGDEPPSRS